MGKEEEEKRLYEIETSDFNIPFTKFKKFQTKERKYLTLYHNNKYKYYFSIFAKIMKRHLKARFVPTLLSCVLTSAAFYILTKLGIIDFLGEKLSNTCTRIANHFIEYFKKFNKF
jgi:hypothetical protein